MSLSDTQCNLITQIGKEIDATVGQTYNKYPVIGELQSQYDKCVITDSISELPARFNPKALFAVRCNDNGQDFNCVRVL